MSDQPQPQPQPPQPGKRINIDIPKDLQAVYANVAFISHTPAEVVLDFAQVLPRMPRGSVQARVIMSPMHAKMLQQALAQNIANYERQFGEIRLPQQMNLADQFFRFPQQDSDDDNKENKSDPE
ncbi:MAG: DUF3467 domain-containing protein [Chloroflexi bacterium]|jgi:hypothetical protein|nr:DUF3467 domain-containing protein [Chloroflexota bacterium]MBK6712460.1 DUF3467 domain-containing protein [Chloroflexota bacterium]MBK7178346.1 DUF3467 domain-containing protein [Chloroflexota bacterium]MBK7916457.1 DUF3467 domain-containing protein [Chloroflexota bacterium]MBK8933835.1 DUF3467 domain-containing protein [Chloroflexota bacterium]